MSPVMSTERVRLHPITDRHSAFLYELMTSPEAGGRVRFAGATPSPEKVAATLWDSVLAQFILEGTATQHPLGLVSITSPNLRDGFCYLSAVGTPTAQGTGLIAEGVLLAFNYAFATWPFRKIYMEVSEVSYPAFRTGLGRFFVEEGRLREHVFWAGRYHDVRILAVYRATWAEHGTEVLARLSPNHRSVVSEDAGDRPVGPPVVHP
jgi:RimJ/RimL family protein N-acetyltransferase